MARWPAVALLLLLLTAVDVDAQEPPSCFPNLEGRAAEMNGECCDEPTEDCSSGRPATCNVGCASLLLPFFSDCGSELGKAAADFDNVVALCVAAQAAAGIKPGGGGSPPSPGSQHMDPQCQKPYTTRNEPWRSPTNGHSYPDCDETCCTCHGCHDCKCPAEGTDTLSLPCTKYLVPAVPATGC